MRLTGESSQINKLRMRQLPSVAPIGGRDLLVSSRTIFACLDGQKHVDIADLLGTISMPYGNILYLLKIRRNRGLGVLKFLQLLGIYLGQKTDHEEGDLKD